MKFFLLFFLFLLCLDLFSEDTDSSAYKTLNGLKTHEEENAFFDHSFESSFSLTNIIISTIGLTRFSKHQDEINAIYSINLAANSLLLYRSLSFITGNNSLYDEPIKQVSNLKDINAKEKASQYKLLEISNSQRQLRKISSYFTILTGLISGIFSEGKKFELSLSSLYFCNGLLNLFLYESQSENIYDKYIFQNIILSFKPTNHKSLTEISYRFKF